MNSNKPVQNFPIDRLILAPDDPAEWEAWREFLNRWREEVRVSLAYDERLYTRPDFAWVSGCFTCALIMVWDQAFYDPETRAYRIEALLESGQAEFGGYDAIVLWQAYPNLGFDDRNQFDFFRDMPGARGSCSRRKGRCRSRACMTTTCRGRGGSATRPRPAFCATIGSSAGT